MPTKSYFTTTQIYNKVAIMNQDLVAIRPNAPISSPFTHCVFQSPCRAILSGPNWTHQILTWWRHQMETFSALLAICAGNSPVPGEFPTQRPVTRSFDVYFDLRPNKWLSKQSWGWWFETLSCSLWRHRNERVVHSFQGTESRPFH